MSLDARLRSFFGHKQARPIARPSRRFFCKPVVELLEDRLAPATFTVNSFLDTDNLLAPGVGPTTLRKAIRLAEATPAADTINFAAALTNKTILLTNGEFAITKPVTITGLGSTKLTIDANGNSRVFRIDDSNVATKIPVSISGLKLTHGNAPSAGGIFNSENLTLTNSTLLDNSANGAGGISNTGILSLTNCILSENSAQSAGGIGNSGTLTIANSTLFDNQAFSGGAISNSGTLTITNSTLSANIASLGGGGGIDNLGTATLTNTTLSDNRSQLDGGGVFNRAGAVLTMTNTTLSRNLSSIGDGGGVHNEGTMTLTNSTLSLNSAVNGGGISNSNGLVVVERSILSANSTTNTGGGIHNNGGTVRITNSTLSGNSAAAPGGGILNSAGTLTLINSTLAANATSHNGGGISSSGTVTLMNSTLSANSAALDGGGIHFAGAGASLSLTNSTLSANSAGNDGGGIVSVSGPVTLTNATVSGNFAIRNGGGIRAFDVLTATNSTIVGNRADSDSNLFGLGGGLNISTVTTLVNSIVAGNVKGGGVANDISGVNVAAASFNNLFGDPASSGAIGHGVNFNIVGKSDGIGGRILLPLAEILDATLRNNGGPTRTHALAPGSVAIDAGNIVAVTLASEVQTISVSETAAGAGTFTLTFNGQTTALLFVSSTTLATETQSALNALSTISGVGGSVTVTRSVNKLTVTFGGALATMDVAQIIGNENAIASVSVATLTTGRTGPFSPTAGSEVQTVTVTGATGTFTLTFNGQSTIALPFDATATQMQSALNSLATINSNGGAVAVVKSGNAFVVTFGGTLTNVDVPAMTAAGSGGVNAIVVTTTNGHLALFTDQRATGFTRLVGTHVDIGAFEMPRPLFTDHFNRVGPALGAPWVKQAGAIGIAFNAAQGTGIPTVHIATIAGLSATDVDLYADVTVSTNQQGGILARYAGAGDKNYYFASITRGATGVVTARIVRNVNGVVTELAAVEGVFTLTGTAALRFRLVGATLQLFANRELIVTVQDTSLKSGAVGMRAIGAAVDNFQVWTVSTGADNFDSFQQPDNTMLSDPWARVVGFYRTVANQVQGIDALNLAILNGVQQADVDVQASVNIAGLNHSAGLLARYQGPGDKNYYLAKLTRTGVGFAVQLNRNVNGVNTILASVNVASTTGKANLRLLVTGINLKVYVNSALTINVLDSSLTKGSVGIRSDGFAALDDFRAAAVTTEAPFTDNFNQADATGLGGNWTRRVGDFKMINNAAFGTSPAPAVNLATLIGLLLPGVEVQANVTLATTNHQIGLLACFNGKGDSNYYMARVFKTANGFHLAIVKNLAGVLTTLKFVNVPALTGAIRFRVEGTSLKLFMNNVEQLSATDTSLTGGSVGIRSVGTGTIDNFAATAVAFLPFTDAFPAPGLSNNWIPRAGAFNTGTLAAPNAALGTANLNLATLGRFERADVDVQAVFSNTAQNGKFASLVARYSGTGDSNMYLATIAHGPAGAVASITKKVYGVNTLLASVPVGVGVGTLRFTVIGSKLTLFLNGAELLSASDFSLKTGSVGIRSSLGSKFDDFTLTG